MLIDTHCHLFNEYYDDIQGVLDRAANNGVEKVVVAADNIASCYEVIENSKKYDNYYFCLGIHPEEVNDSLEELTKIIEDNINNPKFVAIGEIGLDYYWTKDNKQKQIEIFEYQLKLAEKYNKPVIVHSREATKDTEDILAKYNVVVDIHCFSGSLETAKIYIKRGYYIGVGGVLTFKNSNLKDIIKEIPLDNILLETDSPYLSPVPHRGETNEPAYIRDIGEYLASIKNITLEDVKNKTTKNATKIFHI